MIAMLKSMVQKPLFWIAMGGITLVIIFASLFFQQNEPPFRFEPMPKEDLEVKMENGKQIVDAKKDGYILKLNPEYTVVTREIESGRVMIFKGECRMEINKVDDTVGMTVQAWYERDKAWEEYAETLSIRDYHIEKIQNFPLEFYYSFLDSEQFGLEKSILIQGKNGIFSISQNTPDCFSYEEILKGFSFK